MRIPRLQARTSTNPLNRLIFLAAISLWLLLWSPVPYNKYFVVSQDFLSRDTDIDDEVINPQFANPKRKQIIPIIADALAAVFTPFVVIIVINLLGIGTYSSPKHRTPRLHRRGSLLFGRGSFWNTSNGCIGVVYAVMTGCVIQIIIKLVVPGLRPHFLTVCDPQISAASTGTGYRQLYYTATVCRDYKNRESLIANAMQSFPSGHSVAAWAGMFYCSLYINAHLKVFSNYHPSYWKLLLFVTPMLAATLMVGALTLDMSHNWYDIVVGSLIGVATAWMSYRMLFASVWDYRFNHIPLLRHREGFGYGEAEMVEWMGGVATRRAGWGTAAGRLLGAPGDLLRGHAEEMGGFKHGVGHHGVGNRGSVSTGSMGGVGHRGSVSGPGVGHHGSVGHRGSVGGVGSSVENGPRFGNGMGSQRERVV